MEKGKCGLLRAPRVKIYCAHSCGDQPVSSVTAGVHNVLLQCYIFISVVCACVYERPLPYRAVLSWLGLKQQQRGGHCGERSQPPFAARSSLAARLAPALFIFSRDI